LLLSFADINLVGDAPTRESARVVANAVAELAATRVPIKAADIEPIKLEMQPLLEIVGDRLKEFRLEARHDLDYEKRGTWWRRALPWNWRLGSRGLTTTTPQELVVGNPTT